MDSKVKRRLRSQDWFGKQDKDGFIHRSWLKNQGYPDDMFDGRPVIGICNTWSELTPCNGHFREIAEFVKRGVLEAGGFPLEFLFLSLCVTLLYPTAFLFFIFVCLVGLFCFLEKPKNKRGLLWGCYI